MTVDSSALIAVLFAEPGYLDLADRILAADHVRIGPDAGRNQPADRSAGGARAARLK